ncbi:MAG: hypothetical protein ACI91F_002851 [Candidatus Binatia bacterium]
MSTLQGKYSKPVSSVPWAVKSGEKRPHIESGLYDGVVVATSLERPFGRHSAKVDIRLTGMEICYFDEYEPPEGFDHPQDLIIPCNYPFTLVDGVACYGRTSKLYRSLVAVFGAGAEQVSPDELLGQAVQVRVDSVTKDSEGNPLPPSEYYSKVRISHSNTLPLQTQRPIT